MKAIMLSKRFFLYLYVVLCLFVGSLHANVEKIHADFEEPRDASATIFNASIVPVVNDTQKEEMHEVYVENLATDAEANQIRQVASNGVQVEKQNKQEARTQDPTKAGFVLAAGLIVIGVMVTTFRKRKVSVREKGTSIVCLLLFSFYRNIDFLFVFFLFFIHW
jgi:hypothetical protein